MNTNDQKETQGKPAGRRRGCLGRVAVTLVALLAVGMVAGAIYQAAATANDLKRYPPQGKLYDVGGYRLHLYCLGQGSPTVILEAGAASPAVPWYVVQKEVAGFTRACSYDRAGFGWSDPAPGPLSPGQVAADLRNLLRAADVPGPYILVGHSAGGFYVRAYASQYPAEVAGLVLVDSAHEQQDMRYPAKYVSLSNSAYAMLPLCQMLSPFGGVRALGFWNAAQGTAPAEFRAAYLSTLYRNAYCGAMANEGKAISAFLSQPDIPESVGDLPLAVLSAPAAFDKMPKAAVTAMGGPEVLAQVREAHDEMQQDLVGLSTKGKLIIAAEGGHFIQVDQPDLVIGAIREMVQQVRGE